MAIELRVPSEPYNPASALESRPKPSLASLAITLTMASSSVTTMYPSVVLALIRYASGISIPVEPVP